MFKDGDILCFLGDSITASGLWESEVYQILRKNIKSNATTAVFPELRQIRQ